MLFSPGSLERNDPDNPVHGFIDHHRHGNNRENAKENQIGRRLPDALQNKHPTASGSDPAAARVELRGTPSSVHLRVGQRLERTTGKIAEPYETASRGTQSATPSAKIGKSATRNKTTPSDSEAPSIQSSDD
jgi:hypothetical protein